MDTTKTPARGRRSNGASSSDAAKKMKLDDFAGDVGEDADSTPLQAEPTGDQIGDDPAPFSGVIIPSNVFTDTAKTVASNATAPAAAAKKTPKPRAKPYRIDLLLKECVNENTFDNYKAGQLLIEHDHKVGEYAQAMKEFAEKFHQKITYPIAPPKQSINDELTKMAMYAWNMITSAKLEALAAKVKAKAPAAKKPAAKRQWCYVGPPGGFGAL